MSLPKSLQTVVEQNPSLEHFVRGLPGLGQRPDGQEFSPEVKRIHDVFGIYGNGLYELLNDKIKDIPSKSLGGGSPMKTPPFPPCQKALIEAITYDDMSEYPMAAGDEKSRKEIAEYLKREGFESPDEINEDNVIFTMSTTQAFSIISSLITRPHDVILMTGPNYGLFTFVPERTNNADVEILPLNEEDDWYVNPSKLESRILEINEELKKKYEGKLPYTPRVRAFLNENPHNPLGKVLSNKNIDILRQLSKIANEKEIFIIDDMVYRDICYDNENIAKPLATLPKNFENTITLLGLSKSYGLASIRAGIVVADEIVIRELRNKIFQHMDSLPNIQISALTGAFNSSEKRYKYYERYFSRIRKEYIYRYDIISVLINGISFVKNKKNKTKIERLISKVIPYNDCSKILKNGIAGLKLVNNIEPEAGFFTLVDFTELKGKKYDYIIINNDRDLLEFFYYSMRVKFLIGSSFSFPNKDKLVGRITFALEPLELVKAFYAIYKATLLLK